MHMVYSRERAPPRHKTGAASNQRHAKQILRQSYGVARGPPASAKLHKRNKDGSYHEIPYYEWITAAPPMSGTGRALRTR